MGISFRKIHVTWVGWGGDWFVWNLARFNSGYPYRFWRIGPFFIKRYM